MRLNQKSFGIFYNKVTASEIAAGIQEENLKKSMGEAAYNRLVFYQNKSKNMKA